MYFTTLNRHVYNIPRVVGHHFGHAGVSPHQTIDIRCLLELVR